MYAPLVNLDGGFFIFFRRYYSATRRKKETEEVEKRGFPRTEWRVATRRVHALIRAYIDPVMNMHFPSLSMCRLRRDTVDGRSLLSVAATRHRGITATRRDSKSVSVWWSKFRRAISVQWMTIAEWAICLSRPLSATVIQFSSFIPKTRVKENIIVFSEPNKNILAKNKNIIWFTVNSMLNFLRLK